MGSLTRSRSTFFDCSSTKRSSIEYVSTLLLLLTRYFPNTLPTYLGVLCGCVVCGCLFVWLCGSWLCVWWHHCGRAIVLHCVPAPCVARADNRGGGGGGEPVSGIGPYPAPEEIDRRPLVISCRQSVKTAVESAAALSGRVVATLLWCQLFAQAVTIVPPYKANDSALIRAKIHPKKQPVLLNWNASQIIQSKSNYFCKTCFCTSD